jgi:hypothetical protein
MNLKFASLALYGAIAAVSLDSVHAEPRTIPGSRVTIDAPSAFETTDRFAGFMHKPTGASVVVLDVPVAAYDEMKTGFTPERLATRGVVKATVGELTGYANPHVYITAEQADTVMKFLLLTKSDASAALVSMNVPKTALSSGALTVAQVEAMLRSTVIALVASPKTLAFSVSHQGLLKAVAEPTGQMLMFTLDGQRDPKAPTPGRVMFLAVPSHSPVATGTSIKDLAAAALRSIAGTTNVKITGERDMTIATLKGTEHRASANDSDGQPLVVYQVMLANPAGGYYRMVGQAPAADADQYMPEFEKLALSFRTAK